MDEHRKWTDTPICLRCFRAKVSMTDIPARIINDDMRQCAYCPRQSNHGIFVRDTIPPSRFRVER